MSNTEEHILVCLSASPTNAKIIRTAAKMAKAFEGNFTAIYVQTSNAEQMDEESKNRLQEHIHLAEKFDATIATVYGDDISYQIAEFARLSGVTKIVIGRSNMRRNHIWSKPTLTEKLVEIAPNVDIHIIPDSNVDKNYREKKKVVLDVVKPSFQDLIVTISVLIATTGIGILFWKWGFTESNIITIYILGVLIISLFAKSYFCSIFSSLAGVLLFNFFFTEPRLTLHAYEQGYPVTFAIMLTAALITGTLANKLKQHAKQTAQAAFRTKILFDTNQLLHNAQNEREIIQVVAKQLMKLLDRHMIIYSEENGELGKLYSFPTGENINSTFHQSSEVQIADWTLKNRKRAGATTEQWRDSENLYLSIRINQKAYGVIGIQINQKPLDSFEMSVLLSILGECALAIDNIRNAYEKEQAAILAHKEQLRANLLRAISHDLRTPLTSISGHASNLLSNYEHLDEDMRKQMFTDIYDDSQWLISLVENLLSVTRIEEGRLNFHVTTELMDEVIEEALKHVNRKKVEHDIQVIYEDDMLLAKMDVKLILQVIINLIDNAIKYTPAGSEIKIIAKKDEHYVIVSVIDNGEGISDEWKPRVFEMFFTGKNKIVDSRRSLGLGLALCKSIINAHGGAITLQDHVPQGCNFTFTIPLGEVDIYE